MMSGFSERGGRLAAGILSMVDDTELAFGSISTYIWGVRTWHELHHQPDPAFGATVHIGNDSRAAVRVCVAGGGAHVL